MALVLLSSGLQAFMPPPTLLAQSSRHGRGASSVQSASSVQMQFNMPKIDLGGIEIESFGDKWNKDGDLQLIPSDVQFKDVDGDTITFRGRGQSKVDYYNGSKLMLKKAVLEVKGTNLLVTGTVQKSTPLSLLGFNLEDTITEQITPVDPDDLVKASALI